LNPPNRSIHRSLRPLKADAFGTGRWWYDGEPMRPEQVEIYTDEDFAEDGRLKRYDSRSKLSPLPPSTTRKEMAVRIDNIRAKWLELAEPRPEFLEWATEELKPDLFRELATAALVARTPTVRQGAIRTLLEFTKAKPKQAFEVSTISQEPAEPQELMAVFSQVFGIPVLELEKLIKPN